MRFRKSAYHPEEGRVCSNAGSSSKPSFKMKIDENGRRSLVTSGIIDTYAQIQSHKESVDIQAILTRYSNGDTSALSKVQGLYGDFTNIPTSLNELHERVEDANKLFYQLPVETRAQFEHNPSMFYRMIGTDAFNTIMGVDKTVHNPMTETPAPVPSTTPEVNTTNE